MQTHRSTRFLVSVVVALALPALPTVPSTAAEVRYAADGTFTAKTVEEIARALSRSGYASPKSALPDVLAKLDYDGYRDIRSRPGSSIWAKESSLFQLQVLSRGFLFVDPVEIAVVENGVAKHVAYSPDFFVTGDIVKAPLPAEDVGFSGFRILFPINRPSVMDEIAVFQGASYFRAVGAKQVYGLSARGLALKTAEPEGEEFPAFRAFWVERPQRSGQTIVVHALLDSPSVAGAYRFQIHPGWATTMDVSAVLFPRTTLSKIGIAPATSMFMFSANGREKADDYRPEVHDSDGLLILNGRGERVWRPLANPAQLQVSAFIDSSPKGFGLMQRNRSPQDYQDFEALYEKRPALWIEPSGDWGKGAVVLVEIPSDAEIHDNIVAFWRPAGPIDAGAEYRFGYKLSWDDEPRGPRDWVRVIATRRGRADVRAPTPVRRFIVDFAGGTHLTKTQLPAATVTASAGAIRDVVVGLNPLIAGGIRLSFVLDPKDAKSSELRTDLVFKDKRRAETWLYRWTAP